MTLAEATGGPHRCPSRIRRDGAGQTAGVSAASDAAALDSLAHSADELARRVAALADRYEATQREDVRGLLRDAERALVNASRRLAAAMKAVAR